MKTVIDLSTGNEYTYNEHVTPALAVFSAWMHSQGNMNTWEYNNLMEKHLDDFVYGERTVAIGDFCCKID